MSFIGLKLPHETARLLSDIDVPGQKESTDHFHITMLHLGDEIPIETLAEAVVTTHKITSNTRPFTISTSRVTCFSPSPEGIYPIICRVDSDEIHALWKSLCKAFDKAGIEYSKKWPEFKPHVTLAFAPEEIEERRIPTVEWGAHELVLWGGDEGDKRLVVTFPFSIDAKIAHRVATKWASHFNPLLESP
jgi:RNA 2',3'-cyclic 3'-phosphodiesterase